MDNVNGWIESAEDKVKRNDEQIDGIQVSFVITKTTRCFYFEYIYSIVYVCYYRKPRMIWKPRIITEVYSSEKLRYVTGCGACLYICLP